MSHVLTIMWIYQNTTPARSTVYSLKYSLYTIRYIKQVTAKSHEGTKLHGGSILCPHAILALCNLVPSCNFDQFIYEIDIKTVKHQILFYNKYKLNNFDNKSIVVLYTNLSNKAVYEYSCSLTLFMKQVFFL